MRSILAYHRPRTLEEAIFQKCSLAPSRWLAGGTDLLVKMKEGRTLPCALVSLRAIPELARTTKIPGNGCVRIGSMVPLEEIRRSPELAERYGALHQALGAMASLQVRNVATLGGNLANASPCADGAPPLLVHEARVEIVGPAGRRTMRLEELFAGPSATSLTPHELLAAVILDPPPEGARSVFLKKTRVAMDLGLASVAALVVMEGPVCRVARLAAGAVAPTPVRLAAAERLLEGRALTPELAGMAAAAARDEIRPISDLRASADYRRHIVGVYVRRALAALAAPAAAAPREGAA